MTQAMERNTSDFSGYQAGSGGRLGPVRAIVTLAVAAVYCFICFVPWAPEWSGSAGSMVGVPRYVLTGGIGNVLGAMGWSPSGELVGGVYLFVMAVVIPWLFLAVFGRGRGHDLGLRRPNRIGWRVLFVSYVLSIPFLVWMARSPEIAGYYVPHFRRAGTFSFLSFYTVNMVSEHFLLHGMVLALLRPGWRWPDAPPVVAGGETRVTRWLRWIGLAQPVEQATGDGRVRAWLGLREACGWAIVGSALLFALVHVGKDARELVLSLPGGVALAYLAYRTNSMLTPLILHLATAATAFVLMIGLA